MLKYVICFWAFFMIFNMIDVLMATAFDFATADGPIFWLIVSAVTVIVWQIDDMRKDQK